MEDTIHEPTPIEILAEYFTGPLVVHNSIGLGIPSQRENAKRFFDVRSHLGIVAYMTKDEALKAIIETVYSV